MKSIIQQGFGVGRHRIYSLSFSWNQGRSSTSKHRDRQSVHAHIQSTQSLFSEHIICEMKGKKTASWLLTRTVPVDIWIVVVTLFSRFALDGAVGMIVLDVLVLLWVSHCRA